VNKIGFTAFFLTFPVASVVRFFYKILLPIVMKTAGRSIEWIIMRLMKVGAKVAYHAKYRHVHTAATFPLRHHYWSIFGKV